MKKYNVGDIVFVSEYEYDNGRKGSNHLFVIIDSDNVAIPIEYFGFLISTQIKKSKYNSPYEYNEPLYKTIKNGLDVDSIVKCDSLYRIPDKAILFKVGVIDPEDIERFIESFKKWLTSQELKIKVEVGKD